MFPFYFHRLPKVFIKIQSDFQTENVNIDYNYCEFHVQLVYYYGCYLLDVQINKNKKKTKQKHLHLHSRDI